MCIRDRLPASIAQAERQGGIGFLCCADHLGGGVHPQHIGLGVAVRQLSGAVPGPTANVNHFGRIFVGNAAEQILRRACPVSYTHLVGPKVLGQATTEMFNGIMGKISGTGSGIDFGKIGGILLTLLGLYLASAAFSVIQGWLMTGVSMKVTYRLRNSIMQKINRMPLGYFDRVNHGEVLSRVTNDVDTLSQTLNQSIKMCIRDRDSAVRQEITLHFAGQAEVYSPRMDAVIGTLRSGDILQLQPYEAVILLGPGCKA